MITKETYLRAFALSKKISENLEAQGIDTWDFDGVKEYTIKEYGFNMLDLENIIENYLGQQKNSSVYEMTEEEAAKTVTRIEALFSGTSSEQEQKPVQKKKESFPKKVAFEFNGKETFATLKEWKKGKHHRIYISDDKGKQYGYYDVPKKEFCWNGSPSNWKDEVEKAIEEAIEERL